MIKFTGTELTECGKKMNNDGEKEQTKMMKMKRKETENKIEKRWKKEKNR